MRIEISSGGIGNGSSALDFQTNINSFIATSDAMISSLKAVKNDTYNLSGGVGNLQSALDDIGARIQTEEFARTEALSIQAKANDFLALANRVDRQVSSDVNNNRDELYNVCPWLRPVAETTENKPWYEQALDLLCGAGEAIADGLGQSLARVKATAIIALAGLFEHYNNYNKHKKIIDTILIVVGAVGAIAAVIVSGGLAGAALIPLLTTVFGMSTAVASTISATIAVVAVISTVAASTLNIIDVWAEIDNPTFNVWQKGLNITSAVSNLLNSIGGIYNSVKGHKLFSRVDWTGYPKGAEKPTGFYRLLSGKEYYNARKAADKVNASIHRNNSSLAGLQIHEIHPVKFGGSPSSVANKLFLTPEEHAKITVFWNRLMGRIK